MEHSKIFLWINYKVLMSKLPRHCEISPALPWNGAHYGRNLYCRENKRGMSLVFMYTSVLHPHHKHHQHTHKLILQWNKKVGLSIWEPRIYFYTYTCTWLYNDYAPFCHIIYQSSVSIALTSLRLLYLEIIFKILSIWQWTLFS